MASAGNISFVKVGGLSLLSLPVLLLSYPSFPLYVVFARPASQGLAIRQSVRAY